MASQNPTIRIRVNQIDYTLQPSGVLDNTTLPRVPVIRIYGESSVGIKACVHVHQVFPYFFLDYIGKMSPEHGAPWSSTNNCKVTHMRFTSEPPYS